MFEVSTQLEYSAIDQRTRADLENLAELERRASDAAADYAKAVADLSREKTARCDDKRAHARQVEHYRAMIRAREADLMGERAHSQRLEVELQELRELAGAFLLAWDEEERRVEEDAAHALRKYLNS